MSHPARETIADGRPPWKDHIYIGFWDVASACYGFLHWNSSPNHDTGKAQLSGSFGGVHAGHQGAAAATRHAVQHTEP